MNHLMLRGLEDEAHTVRTPAFTDITTQLAFAKTFHGTMVVAGEHGTGKRFALMTCLGEQDLPFHLVTMPPAVSAKDMVRLLYEAVHDEDDVFALRDMQDELIETLSGTPRIIVIDGAEQLTAAAAEQLHYLHRRVTATWTLVLLGGPDTARTVATSAGLRGEVIAAVEMRPLTGSEIRSAVRAMHQLFLIPDQLFEAIDKQVCKGMLKNWACFLRAALYLQRLAVERGEDPPFLDPQLARAVVQLMPTLKTSKRR
ncbi:ATP-binding protein [Oryzihumus leptocrescens]|uniref:AAA domain-containing protein n=1 Tax=Oryzihumus leptocrescens TaxID=297536 RepID=A0A542ZLD9_9MICO|nr:ATP-binding protein [Oryzihumus leptocrescens]TQL60980.1 AAA domain-containing protein [Oryzihumus leptocrescens]